MRCFQLSDAKGDVFGADDDALAHSVSEDLVMGKGIALDFRTRFGGVDDLTAQKIPIGGVGVLERNSNVPNRGSTVIYYLVTKKQFWGKPTLRTLESSLVAMREDCLARGIRTIAMPRIGCGLDRLRWIDVQALIIKVFANTTIKISAYHL